MRDFPLASLWQRTCDTGGMLSQLRTATINGIEATPVDVEVNISGGMPGFHLVGLPTGSVREGVVRIRAALENSGFAPGAAKVTVNLAPADLRKDGAAFDLPIALGVLGACGLSTIKRQDLLVCGELALDGKLKPLRGALSMAQAVRSHKLAGIVLPASNASEASMIPSIEVYGVETLREAAALLAGGQPRLVTPPQVAVASCAPGQSEPLDFSEVCGQHDARIAAEIAAAGGHNLMLVGPPGSGKTMIARRISTILPPLTVDEAIETTMIHSVAGTLRGPLVGARPFRAPHHTVSSYGLVGGGSNPRPGEVSLAHNGVLFLDELPEFPRQALEALRQPMEDRQLTIARVAQSVTYPASFMLVAAMNPCPCGYRGSRVRVCICGDHRATNYSNRISGPLWDRFDLTVGVEPVALSALIDAAPEEPSSAIRERVDRARARQARRSVRLGVACNGMLGARALKAVLRLEPAAKALLQRFALRERPSARALSRISKVALTIADLADSERVAAEHLALALAFQREAHLAE